MPSWTNGILSRLFDARRTVQEAPYSAPNRLDVIAICNQKGGCGKTTTAVNLAAGLAMKGFPTLLVDVDPQANASLSFGMDVERLPVTVYDLFSDSYRHADNAILQTKIPYLSLVPANSLLSGAQLELASVLNRENVLRQVIRRFASRFRFVIIDCSPSLNLLTINALVASDYVLVPLQPHYYALEGMKELFTTIELIHERFNSDLSLLGILPVFVDSRTRVIRDLLEQIRSYFKEQVTTSEIRFSSKIIESSIAGQPVIQYAPYSAVARDYQQLSDEILVRIEQEQLVPR